MLKELIKKLSAEQKALKPQRKTGSLVGLSYDCEILTKSHRASSKVQDNRLMITAALNLYHELRGSEHRHGVDESDAYAYKCRLKEVSDLVAATKSKGGFVV